MTAVNDNVLHDLDPEHVDPDLRESMGDDYLDEWSEWPDYPFDDDQIPGAWEADYPSHFTRDEEGDIEWEYPDNEPVSFWRRIWNEIIYQRQNIWHRINLFCWHRGLHRCSYCGRWAFACKENHQSEF